MKRWGKLKIFTSHGNSCRILGSVFEYEGFLFFNLCQNETQLSPHSSWPQLPTRNSGISSCFKHPQPPNTHTLWNHVAWAGRLKAIFLCSFEECQVISHCSCHKTETCCLKVELNFPNPRPARAGPLSSIFTQGESACLLLLYWGCRCWGRQSPSLSLLQPAVPHLGRTGLERSSQWPTEQRGPLCKPTVLFVATSDIPEFYHYPRLLWS